MRKESADEVAEVARRRLAELGRELARSGYPTVGASAEPDLEPVVEQRAREGSVEIAPVPVVEAVAPGPPWPDDELAVAAPVPIPGRHARQRPPTSDRGVALLLDRLPATLQGRVSLGAGHVAVL